MVSRWHPSKSPDESPSKVTARSNPSAVYSRNPYSDFVPKIETAYKKDEQSKSPTPKTSPVSPLDAIILQRGRTTEGQMIRHRRSQSVPRISRPIATTTTHEKRTKFNEEKIRAITEASLARKRERDLDAVLTSPPRATSATGRFSRIRSRPTTPDFFVTKKTPSRGIATKATSKSITEASGYFFKNSKSTEEVPAPLKINFASEETKEPPLKRQELLVQPKETAAKSQEATVEAAEANLYRRERRRSSENERHSRRNDREPVVCGNASRRGVKLAFNLRIRQSRGRSVDAVTSTPDSPTNRVKSNPDSTVPVDFATALRDHDTPVKRSLVSRSLSTPDSSKESKSSIIVGVRVRPFSTLELKKGYEKRVVELDTEYNVVRVKDKLRTHEFEFNHVFDSFDPIPYHDQEHVYKTLGKPLLDHSLDGYNSCLFAYGATGSGKTYSMTGDEQNFEDQGIIPRMIRDLFMDMTLGSSVSVTYIEVYNEEIFNLLDSTSIRKVPYKVREHPIHGPYIPSLGAVIVDSSEELISLWQLGNIKRAKAATASNERSSRSHAILRITVEQKFQEEERSTTPTSSSDSGSVSSTGERLVSTINLVDLAGSERVAAAQTTGERFKEGTAINKSLLTLGKIISQLSSCTENQRSRVHVSYRESILTFLLKESLGGNSRTCMLATISPSSGQTEETISTLRYASKTSKIVNVVRINEDPKDIRIRKLQQLLSDVIRELEDEKLKKRSLSPELSSSSSDYGWTTNADKQTAKKIKESGTQHQNAETKDTGVSTIKEEPKRPMIRRAHILPAPQSTFIKDITEIFDGILKEVTKPVVTVKSHVNKGTSPKATIAVNKTQKKESTQGKLPSPIHVSPKSQDMTGSQTKQDTWNWNPTSNNSSQTNTDSYQTALDQDIAQNLSSTDFDAYAAVDDKNGSANKDEFSWDNCDWAAGEKEQEWSEGTVKAADQQEEDWETMKTAHPATEDSGGDEKKSTSVNNGICNTEVKSKTSQPCKAEKSSPTKTRTGDSCPSDQDWESGAKAKESWEDEKGTD